VLQSDARESMFASIETPWLPAFSVHGHVRMTNDLDLIPKPTPGVPRTPR